MNTSIDKLLANSYSTQQLRNRLRILKSYLEKKFFNKEDGQDIDQMDNQWLESLGDEFLNQFTQINAYEKLKQMEDEIDKIIPLIIYVAFEMPQEEIEKMGIWLRLQMATSLVCEVKVDPNLIAGCALSWKGVYKDYSIRQKIENSQEQILSSLKQFKQ